MKRYGFELKKIVTSRFFRILFLLFSAAVFVSSLFLSKRPDSLDAVLRAYESHCEDSEKTDAYFEELNRFSDEHIRDLEVNFPCTYDVNKKTDDFLVLMRAYERIDYLSGHENQIEKIAWSAKRRISDLSGFGYTENSYEIRAQKELEKHYTAMEGVISVESGYAYGYDVYLSSPLLPLLIMLFITIGAVWIFKIDFDCGVHTIQRTSRFGGKSTAITKILAVLTVVLVTVVLFSLLSLAAVWLSYGLSSPLMPIQAFPAFYAVPFGCSVLGYLLLHLGIRLLAFSLYAALLSVCAALQMPYVICFLFAGVVNAVNLIPFLYEYKGTIPAIRYLNLASMAETVQLTDFYRTLNFFGIPVSYVTFALILSLVLILVLFGTVTVLYGGVKRSLPIPLSRLRITQSAPQCRADRLKRSSGSLIFAECKKSRLPLLLLLIAVLLVIRILYVNLTVGNMAKYGEALYYQYILALQKCDDRETYIWEEQDRIDSILARNEGMKQSFEEGNITSAEYYSFVDLYEKTRMEKEIFKEVVNYVDYITLKSEETGIEGRIMYTKGYEKLFGLGTDILLAFALVILCSRSFSVEYGEGKYGFINILRTVRYGRRKTFCLKLVLYMVLGGVISLAFRLATLLTVRHNFIMIDTDAPLFSVMFFSKLTTGITIKEFLIGDLLSQFVVGAMLAGLLCLLSFLLNSQIPYYGVSALLLMLPEAFSHHVVSYPFLSLLSYTCPQVLGNCSTRGGIEGLALTVVITKAIVLVLLICAAGRMFSDSRFYEKIIPERKRRKYEAQI